jgi:hypothetical protein
MGNINHLDEPKPARIALWSGLLVLALILVLVTLAGWYYVRQQPFRWSRVIDAHLDSLVSRRPAEMSPRQWESAVAWTGNLHANSLVAHQADGPTVAALERRIREKLAGKVDLQTIHWIWDEYARVCPGGASYQRFRPLMMEEIEAGGASWSLEVP